jgi:DNA-binding MarR family transcriptional regulator
MGFFTDIIKDLPVSSALKERMALQEEKSALLLAEKDDTIVALQQENAELRLALEQATVENGVLKEQLQKSLHQSDLSEEEQRVLLYIANHKYPTPEQISGHLGITLARSNYFLGKLAQDKFVRSVGGYDRYSIQQKGREYLFAHNLI